MSSPPIGTQAQGPLMILIAVPDFLSSYEFFVPPSHLFRAQPPPSTAAGVVSGGRNLLGTGAG